MGDMQACAARFLVFFTFRCWGERRPFEYHMLGDRVKDGSLSREPEQTDMRREKKKTSVFDDTILISCNVGRLMASFGLYDHS